MSENCLKKQCIFSEMRGALFYYPVGKMNVPESGTPRENKKSCDRKESVPKSGTL